MSPPSSRRMEISWPIPGEMAQGWVQPSKRKPGCGLPSWRNRKLPHSVVSSRLRRVKGSLRVHRNSTQHCPREGFPKEGKINWNIISKKELARRRIGEREGSGRVETLCKSSKLWGIKKTNPLPIQILAKSMWGREVFLYITYLRNICYIKRQIDKCYDKKENTYREKKMGTDILGRITMEDSSEEMTFE